eukprot:gene14800-17499_t
MIRANNSARFLKEPIAGRTNVVLLACGSFNPMTYMHLRMFDQGDNVIGGYMSPVGDAYKKATLIPAAHRIEMCKRALDSSEWLMMDTWESSNTTFTPTRQVLAHVESSIRELGDHHADVQVRLICGADLLSSFNVPKLWADDDMDAITSSRYGIICIERQGSDITKIIEVNPILTRNKAGIQQVPVGMTNDVSSTKLRDLVNRGKSIKYLTPDAVIDYISENKLYQTIH